MRRNARVDANHSMIVAALRQVGASVQDPGKGGARMPRHPRRVSWPNHLMEIKTNKGKATLPQIAWHTFWQGQVVVVRDVDEALHVIGAIR